jgi:hypothetical protein
VAGDTEQAKGATSKMNASVNRWQYFLASLYTWIVSVSSGAILLDTVYSRAASVELNQSNLTAIFSRSADFLLLFSALTLLAGVGAIGFVWGRAAARHLLMASLFFVVVELFTPLLFGSLISKAQTSSGLALGMCIRLAGSTLSSILAFFALWRLKPSE